MNFARVLSIAENRCRKRIALLQNQMFTLQVLFVVTKQYLLLSWADNKKLHDHNPM